MDEETRRYLEECEAEVAEVCPDKRPLRLSEGIPEREVSPELRAAYEAHIQRTPGALEVLGSQEFFQALSEAAPKKDPPKR